MQTMAERNVMRVAVLGAGVVGLTAVSHIQDRFPGQVDLTLISDKFSPDTVSDKSGMIFSLLYHKDAISYQQESEERYKRWICSSFNTFQSIFKSPDNALKFMVLLSGEVLSQSLGGKTTYLVFDVWGWILLRPNPSVSLQTVQKHGAMTHTP